MPRVRFIIFHNESGLVLKIVLQFGALFFPFFHFSFSSTSHRRNEKKTRAHRWWRLCQACHVFAFIFFLFGKCPYIIFFCVCTRALHMCFHSYMCKDLARSSHPPQTMLAPRRHTLFLSFASHSLHPFPLMYRLATRLSWMPRATVTPPPWSSSWRQARTRRQRTR